MSNSEEATEHTQIRSDADLFLMWYQHATGLCLIETGRNIYI